MKKITCTFLIHLSFLSIISQIGCESEESFENCKFENSQWIHTPKKWGIKSRNEGIPQIDTFSLTFLSDSVLLRNGSKYLYYKPGKDFYKLRLNKKGKERHNFADFKLTKKTSNIYIYVDELFGDTVNLELICE